MLRLAHGLRIILAGFYFIGASTHIYISLMHPHFYIELTANAEIELYRRLFAALQPATALVLGLTIALLELCLLALILAENKPMIRGLLVSMLYQVTLIPLGVTGIINLMIALVHLPVIMVELDRVHPIIRHHEHDHDPFLTETRS